ncbi:MAG: flagellar biosynthetic protein FliR [Phycisphaeraceae bacterium]|nr:flagellar biosynthetic protein FliR [Phycisphaeraceae bacterium]
MPGVEALLGQTVPWLLVVARIAGLFVFAPMVSSLTLPLRARALLAAALGLAAAPMVIGAGWADIKPDLISLPWLLFTETMIGVSIGLIAVTPLLALDLAGVLMGHQMGMNLARVYNPETDAEVDAIGQLLFFVGFAAFVVIGGLESLFLALLATFDRVPLGGFGVEHLPLETFVGVLASGMELAARIAAPVWGAVGALMVVMGLLGKFVPQINTMTIGFMLKILLGIGVLAVSMHVIGDVSADAMSEMIRVVEDWVGSLGSEREGAIWPRS